MEDASTIKLIVFPLTFISYFLALIVKFPIALHFPMNPLSFIHSSILVIEPSCTMLDPVKLIALITTTLRVHFSDILSLWMIFVGIERPVGLVRQ